MSFQKLIVTSLQATEEPESEPEVVVQATEAIRTRESMTATELFTRLWTLHFPDVRGGFVSVRMIVGWVEFVWRDCPVARWDPKRGLVTDLHFDNPVRLAIQDWLQRAMHLSWS